MKKNFIYYLRICDYDVLEAMWFFNERRRLKKKGFAGDKDNSDEVFRYEDACGNEPVKKQENIDGTVTFFYADGNRATTCKYIPQSVFPDKETQEYVFKLVHKNK